MEQVTSVPDVNISYKCPLFQDPAEVIRIGAAILKFSKFDPIRQKRCIYADDDIPSLRYATKWKIPIYRWKDLPVLRKIRDIVEHITGDHFPVVLITIYRSGIHVMRHTKFMDYDEGIGESTAELSIGADRNIYYRNLESRKEYAITLEHNSLLLVKSPTYQQFEYRVPVSPAEKRWKISLMFFQYQPPFLKKMITDMKNIYIK